MEPPKGFLATLWNFICFLPYFIGLLILGNIKGLLICPVVSVIIVIGNLCIVALLWLPHTCIAYYTVLRVKDFGPVLKAVLCVTVLPVMAVAWPTLSVPGTIVGGVMYGYFAPVIATFKAVEEKQSNKLYHCFYDGTVSTYKVSLTVLKDFSDLCFHSYFAIMSELRANGLPSGKYYEIKLLDIPGAIVASLIGVVVDIPMITSIASCKSVYMLFKGWHRLFEDLVGREGPFLETICVPFAGLAILLWPLAVVGAIIGSMLASVFIGAFAGVVVYQESSFLFGLCYVVASLALYDEYVNDVLDMPEGTCFPRPKYRRKDQQSDGGTSSRLDSSRQAPSRTPSFGNLLVDFDFKPLELLDSLFKECQQNGELLVSEGLIIDKDIEDAKSRNGSSVIGVGLPAYCLSQTLLRSAKAGSPGLLLSDNRTLTSSNRPKEVVFDWFFNPLLIIKDQIKAGSFTEADENYFCNLVLLSGDPSRLRSSSIGSPPESERKRAELDALARRLRGITKSMSRYPTFRRRFENLVKCIADELEKKNGRRQIQRSKSAFARILGQNSFKNKASNRDDDDQESQALDRDIEIS